MKTFTKQALDEMLNGLPSHAQRKSDFQFLLSTKCYNELCHDVGRKIRRYKGHLIGTSNLVKAGYAYLGLDIFVEKKDKNNF